MMLTFRSNPKAMPSIFSLKCRFLPDEEYAHEIERDNHSNHYQESAKVDVGVVYCYLLDKVCV